MADELTPGEIKRTFDRVEAAQRATNDRLAEQARQMVPSEVWAAQHRALVDRITRNEQDARDARDRIEHAMDARFTTVGKEIASGVKAMEEHERAHTESTAWSRNRVLAAIGITVGAIATLAGAWIAAVLAAKGVG